MSCPRSIIIKKRNTNLVLDACEEHVTLQEIKCNMHQLWDLEHIGLGVFIFTNRGNGKVLDIKHGAECGRPLITYKRHGKENQLWYINSDRTIVNIYEAEYEGLALTVEHSKYKPGANIIVKPYSCGDEQKFLLEYGN